MKRIFLLIISILPMIISQGLSAQHIQDTFFGCKLGESNRRDVKRNINNLGYEYIDENSRLYINDILFSRDRWDMCVFQFSTIGVLTDFSLFISRPPSDREIYYFEDTVFEKLKKEYGETPEYHDIKDGVSTHYFIWDDGKTVLGYQLSLSEKSIDMLLIYSAKEQISGSDY